MSTPDVKLQAVLRSACPPSEEQRSRLTAFLEKKYQQSVELTWSEDKSILGGFRIEQHRGRRLDDRRPSRSASRKSSPRYPQAGRMLSL